MVSVEPPPASEWPASCPITALANLGASRPLCWKNLESSVATTASTKTFGSSSYFNFSRFSLPNEVITLPSLLYNTVVSLRCKFFALNCGADIIMIMKNTINAITPIIPKSKSNKNVLLALFLLRLPIGFLSITLTNNIISK